MEIVEKITNQGLVFDGGMASMLIAAGLQGGELAENWNVDKPLNIRDIHEAYFEAGADVATTNTFGATSFKLEKGGIKANAEAINSAAVQIARKAAGPDNYVVGELGPLGEMFSPMGTMTPEKAKPIYAEQAGILEEAGVDLFIIQTVFDLQEAIAALKAVQSVSQKPVICSLTFNQTKRGFFTLVGNPVEVAMKSLRDVGVLAAGANCSMGSDNMVSLAGEIRKSIEIPVIIQPNAGMPQTRKNGTVFYPEDETFFAENIKKIKALGVEIVGGCCGTTPTFIRKVKESL